LKEGEKEAGFLKRNFFNSHTEDGIEKNTETVKFVYKARKMLTKANCKSDRPLMGHHRGGHSVGLRNAEVLLSGLPTDRFKPVGICISL
jgi:hypothetical protein